MTIAPTINTDFFESSWMRNEFFGCVMRINSQYYTGNQKKKDKTKINLRRENKLFVDYLSLQGVWTNRQKRIAEVFCICDILIAQVCYTIKYSHPTTYYWKHFLKNSKRRQMLNGVNYIFKVSYIKCHFFILWRCWLKWRQRQFDT